MSTVFAIAQAGALALLLASAPSAAPTDCQRDRGYAPPYSVKAAQAADQPVASAAVYADGARKTFFAYVADVAGDPIRVSCFDHATGTVPKPAILPLAAAPADVDGVSLALDDQGFVWIAVSTAKGGPVAIFKSAQPNDIAAFARSAGPTLGKVRLWHVPNQGFLLLGLRTEANGVAPYFANSTDGQQWAEPAKLAAIDANHTFISARQLSKVGVAIATYAAGQTPADATNIYYLETSDAGRSWQDVRRAPLKLPVTGQEQGLLAWDYRSVQWTVQFKDMGFANGGRPVITYLNSRIIMAGMAPACTWTTARFVPRGWESTGLLPGSCPEDQGLLFLDPGNAWRLLTVRNGKPVPGQEDLIGWFTADQGRSWFKRAMISGRPAERHMLVHVADANPDVNALWLTAPSTPPPTATAPSGATTTAPTSGRPAAATQPSKPAEVLLINREADALLLPADMADTTVKPGTGPVTTRPATQPG